MCEIVLWIWDQLDVPLVHCSQLRFNVPCFCNAVWLLMDTRFVFLWIRCSQKCHCNSLQSSKGLNIWGIWNPGNIEMFIETWNLGIMQWWEHQTLGSLNLGDVGAPPWNWYDILDLYLTSINHGTANLHDGQTSPWRNGPLGPLPWKIHDCCLIALIVAANVCGFHPSAWSNLKPCSIGTHINSIMSMDTFSNTMVI